MANKVHVGVQMALRDLWKDLEDAWRRSVPAYLQGPGSVQLPGGPLSTPRAQGC